MNKKKKDIKLFFGEMWFRGALQTASDLIIVQHSEDLTREFTEFMRTTRRALEGGPDKELPVCTATYSCFC